MNFYQCGKGCHVLYVIINTGQKIVKQNYCQQDQMTKLAKFSGCTIVQNPPQGAEKVSEYASMPQSPMRM